MANIDNRSIKNSISNQNGAVLILTTVILAVVTMLLGFLWSRVGGFVYNEGRAHLQEKVLAITEGGLDKAIWALNANSNYMGETNTALGDGTFSITVANIDSTTKRITAYGYIPNASNPIIQKAIEVEALMSGSEIVFNYGVQAGEGGLILNNNNDIEGNVYSNGNIVAINNVEIFGNTWIAGNIAPEEGAGFTTQNTEYQFGHSSSIRDVAQSFVATKTGRISRIHVLLRKQSTPSDLTVRIVRDVSGNPGGSAQQIGQGTLDRNWITSTLSWIEVPITSTADLTVGQTYWLLLDGGSDSGKYYYWGADTAAGYASGVPKYSSNWSAGGWSSIANRDLNFRVFLGGVTTGFLGNNNIKAYGDIHAHHIQNVTMSGNAYYSTIQNATASSYFPNSPDPPSLPFPISQAQIDDWKAQSESAGVHNGNYTTCNSTLGAKKIQGNLNLNNNCTLTLTGNIWVTGDLILNNNITMKLDASFGGNGGVVVVGGRILLNNNIRVYGSGQSDSFVLLISELNSDNPPAIELVNNIVTDGIFFAPNGKILLNNNTDVLELTGETIELTNNIDIVFEQGISNATIAGGSIGGWAMRDGTWVER